jgi:SAM-dependent methyltransferase
MIPALLVSHRGLRCGVYQFGRRLYEVLAPGQDIAWRYVECDGPDEFRSALDRVKPRLVLFNNHPATLGWATALERLPVTTFSVFHEAHQEIADSGPFDYLLCPDPTLLPRNPFVVPVPRFIPRLIGSLPPAPEIFTIGSFGFCTPGKGFERLCAMVNEQFERARIRINLPYHDHASMVPPDQVKRIVETCRHQVTKAGVMLDITNDFLDDDALLRFLAENTINAFLYDDAVSRGLSSCTDYALACRRPIAVSRSTMFRHLHGINPSICADDRPLRAIAASGIEPLANHRHAYGPEVAGAAWNKAILRALESRAASGAVPDGRGFNKILDDRSRHAYTKALADLRSLAPAMLERKIERANIQQAFALDTAERLVSRFREPRILAVGSYEDTAVAALRQKGFRLDEVDPNVNNLDLERFYHSAQAAQQSYDLILCVSVLEHVDDDRGFVRMIGDLLAPDGVAIFTVDFSERYSVAGQKPAADFRLYTTHDLNQRLMRALPDCALLDVPSWHDGNDDFEYEGCRYSFASWVFSRFGSSEARYALPYLVREGGAPWKEHLRETARDLEVATAQLRCLDRELRFDGGPRSLRIVLPIARAIRRLDRMVARSRGAKPEISEGHTPEINHAEPPAQVQIIGAGSRVRGALKSCLRPVYRYTLRPLLRPIARRTRAFLLAEVRADIADVRRALYGEGPDGAITPLNANLAKGIEAALLTLAIEQRRDREH